MSLVERRVDDYLPFVTRTDSYPSTSPEIASSDMFLDLDVFEALPTGAKQEDIESFQIFLHRNKIAEKKYHHDSEPIVITDFRPVERTVCERGIKKKYKGHLLQTKATGNLLIVPPAQDQQLRLHKKPFSLGYARQEILKRQDQELLLTAPALSQSSDMHNSNSFADHMHVESLLSVGWNHIAPLLYTDEHPIDTTPLNTPYQEVFLNDYRLQFNHLNPSIHRDAIEQWIGNTTGKVRRIHPLKPGIEETLMPTPPTCGSIDILGEGPDRLLAFDIGACKPSKIKRAIKQQLGLRALLQDQQQPISPTDIAVYLTPYFRDTDSVRSMLHVVKIVPITDSVLSLQQ